MRRFLSTETGIYLIIFFIIIPTIIVIPTTIFTNDLTILFVLIIPLLTSIFIFLTRKILFAKIELSSDGIKKVYKNEIQKFIYWKDLIKIKGQPKRFLIFLDKEHPNDLISNSIKNNIGFYVTNKKINDLADFMQFVNCPIENLDIFGMNIKNILLNHKN